MNLKRTAILIALFCQMSSIVFATNAIDFYNKGAKLMQEKGIDSIDEALILFEKSIKTDSSFITGYQAIINALIIKFEASSKKESAILNKALKLTETILKMSPGNAEAYFSKATIYFDLKDEVKGYRELKKALWAAPENMDINIAFFYYILSSKKYPKALKFIESSKKHFLKNANIFLIYADGLLQHSLIKEAVKSIQQAIDIAPEDKTIIITAANLLKQAGSYKQAIDIYKKALNKKPLNNFIYFNLAFCYAGIKDYKNAVIMEQNFTQLEPDHMGAKNNLAVYLENSNSPDKAKEIWIQIRDNPKSSNTYKERAIKHLQN